MPGRAWRVVGGVDKGGILVREGQDTSSPPEPKRLSTGAVVKEIELDGERLNYQRLTGTGPETGWVSTRVADKELLVPATDVWEVVGGGDKGGIMVRQGKDTTSPQEPVRLATDSWVLELELDGERFHFERLTGTGPETGWVSTKLQSGKDLLLKLSSDVETLASEALPPNPSSLLEGPSYEDFIVEYQRRLAAGEIVGPLETYVQRYVAGEVKGGAPGRPSPPPDCRLDADFEARRKAAEENRTRVDTSEAKIPPPWVRLTKKEMETKAKEMLSGDCYGLPVPPTLGELQKLGADWLTRAFHAAQTLEPDNSVTKVLEFKRLPTTTKDAAGGAGPKAILSVEYARPDERLHSELFVKMPWAVEGSKVMGGDLIWRMETSAKGDTDFQECAIYRFLGPIFPFKTPKYYFADICRQNTNYVLITECVKFGKKGQQSFEPYECLPLAEKYLDFQLEPRLQYEMYYALMRAQARLAAWDQLGFFDAVPGEFRGTYMMIPLLGTFPWPSQTPEKARESRARGAKKMGSLLTDFVGDIAKKCYHADLSSKAFLSAIAECMEESGAFQEDIRAYFSTFPWHIGLQHTNLNADNAYFWRKADGELDCGLIDWGGAAPQCCPAVLTGSVTGAEGEVLAEHDVPLLRCFKEEYLRECGHDLDLQEMERQWHLSYTMYLAYLAIHVQQDILRLVKPEEWKTITSLMDTRCTQNWTVRCYSHMLRLALRYLHIRWVQGGKKKLHIHNTFSEWKEYWVKHGLA